MRAGESVQTSCDYYRLFKSNKFMLLTRCKKFVRSENNAQQQEVEGTSDGEDQSQSTRQDEESRRGYSVAKSSGVY